MQITISFDSKGHLLAHYRTIASCGITSKQNIQTIFLWKHESSHAN
jgi:hypothetical protein